MSILLNPHPISPSSVRAAALPLSVPAARTTRRGSARRGGLARRARRTP